MSLYASQPRVYRVSEINALVRALLESEFADVWIEGEISNYKQHASGHIYFTLKDDKAQLNAVIWREQARRLSFRFADGMAVRAYGYLTCYVEGGRYQLITTQLQPRGQGALQQALELLKQQLARRGFFDPAHKKPLPRFPRRIALVTSKEGAALRDMVRILSRRWPLAELWVCPVPVQGQGAAEQIAARIAQLNTLPGIDVMIVGRGGGSLEDLWAFNEEIVAEALFRSRIPTVSAVGHEVDYTIADFVADRRAATPSEAAEIVVPDRREVFQRLTTWRDRLHKALRAWLTEKRQSLTRLVRSAPLSRPTARLHDLLQEVDEQSERLLQAGRRRLQQLGERVQHTALRLDTLSPLNVLKRGYSLTWKLGQSTCVRSWQEVQPGDWVCTRLHVGTILCRVESSQPGELTR
ncbi:MAG: exodeoxyribonuclease VII large subunit [Gemmataceae bacterium]